MEMKKCCSSPRDCIDDELLAKLLDENEYYTGHYGNPRSRKNNNRSCRCRQSQTNVNRAVTCQPEKENSCPESTDDNSCSCTWDEECAKKNAISGYALAMSYTPDQEWKELFETDEAIHHGTIFRELELPFYPACGSCR